MNIMFHNLQSRHKARADLQSMQTEKHFNMQIVECRRVLKWTYAYGYYLPEQEHAKRQFFEYLQGSY
ncbi:hypothetical protein B296_00030706 [Ensete ventricosum]|uniref:Uncharacterized protein n=1 Tax=Ensete ventricosum TaxID=4639 RepID=A0A427AIG7_ENSVE|nr:hypothetical protein B296_00030706 [Ensete ventricosum]